MYIITSISILYIIERYIHYIHLYVQISHAYAIDVHLIGIWKLQVQKLPFFLFLTFPRVSGK